MAASHGKKPISWMPSARNLAKTRQNGENIDELPRRRYFGRQGRALNALRKEAMEALLPRLDIAPHLPKTRATLTPASLFDETFPEYRLEIGFGNGEHLSALLGQHQDIGFIGAEPYVNGMAAFLKGLPENTESRVRVLMDDAMLLVYALEDSCLERIYVLNPDPWPKKRHHKRRIINVQNLDAFARILKPGGQLVMATDVDDLAEWMVTKTMQSPDFEWTAESAADWKNPPAGWPLTTRYAEKGLKAGRRQTYLVFLRK